MQKICILFFCFSFTIAVFAQKKSNPTIGKKEFEISLIFFSENRQQETYYYTSPRDLAGVQIVHRWAWKKYTKIGVGGLAGADNYDPINESDFVPYGALFGDITQFIGKRQKWSVGGQIGHGIFKRERKIEDTNVKAVFKNTAGMYYSISFNYRPIISKKILMVVSPVYTFRNFRQKSAVEYYSPPSNEDYKSTDKFSGLGIRLGVVF
jgi:hypothetical protein